jgi:hypothetical protein
VGALLADRPAVAGALLAVALFKPNVLAIFAAGCIVARPVMLRGAIPVAGLLIGCSIAGCGIVPLGDYLTGSAHLATQTWQVETPPWKTHHLAGMLSPIIPQARLWCTGAGLAAAVWVGLRWRRHSRCATYSRATALACGLLLLFNAVFNPYTPVYDLALLVLALICCGEFAARAAPHQPFCPATLLERPQLLAVQGLVALVYFGPHLSQAGARATGVQLFPLLLLGVAVVLLRWQGATSGGGG